MYRKDPQRFCYADDAPGINDTIKMLRVLIAGAGEVWVAANISVVSGTNLDRISVRCILDCAISGSGNSLPHAPVMRGGTE